MHNSSTERQDKCSTGQYRHMQYRSPNLQQVVLGYAGMYLHLASTIHRRLLQQMCPVVAVMRMLALVLNTTTCMPTAWGCLLVSTAWVLTLTSLAQHACCCRPTCLFCLTSASSSNSASSCCCSCCLCCCFCCCIQCSHQSCIILTTVKTLH